jgi:hypothetical protein
METTKNTLLPYEREFFENLRNYINKPIYFYGSIQRNDYFPQLSDIDIDIFTDNIDSTLILLQNFLNINKEDINKLYYKVGKKNIIIPGYKIKYVDKNKKLFVEISLYNDIHKNDILFEHSYKINLPFYIIIPLIILKFLHYKLEILPEYYYRTYKNFLMNNYYEKNKAEFLILNL